MRMCQCVWMQLVVALCAVSLASTAVLRQCAYDNKTGQLMCEAYRGRSNALDKLLTALRSTGVRLADNDVESVTVGDVDDDDDDDDVPDPDDDDDDDQSIYTDYVELDPLETKSLLRPTRRSAEDAGQSYTPRTNFIHFG